MNKFVIVAFLCIVSILPSKGQEQKKQKLNNNPDEQTIVNKKYDENGNLIQYDSTYVHQWSSDSTQNFSFDNNFGLDDFPQDFDQSTIDSILQHFGIANHFDFPLLIMDDFNGLLNETFSDSIMNHFHFHKDSINQFHLDPQTQIQEFLNNPNFDKWQKQLQDQLKQLNQVAPQFKNDEQQKEWEELIKKQQKEKEELLKKWNSDKKL